LKTAESTGQTEARVGFSKQTRKTERKKERKQDSERVEAVKSTPWTITVKI